MEDNNQVKTIIFSELSKSDKSKYFQFLIENDVNFTKDENGNYVALIKVLNPAFYSNGVNENNQYIENISKNRLDNEEEDKTVRGNKVEMSKTQRRANNFLPSTKIKIETKQKKNQSSNSMIKFKSSSMEKNQNVTGNIKNEIKPIRNDQHKSSSLVNEKKTQPEINSQNKNQTSNIKTTSNNIYLNANYPNFINILKPLIGIRPKKMNIYQLKYQIEELYSIKFMIDTNLIKTNFQTSDMQHENSNQQDQINNDSFPKFIIEFYTGKHCKKYLSDQSILDLLISADYYKDKSREVEIFIKFLNEEYDSEDLIFFLFIRTCIEKEKKILFFEKAKEEIALLLYEDKDQVDTELYLNMKSCEKIAKIVFGKEIDSDKEMIIPFKNKIETFFNYEKNGISANKLLDIMLLDYHNSKDENSISKSNEYNKKIYKLNEKDEIKQEAKNKKSNKKGGNKKESLDLIEDKQEKEKNLKRLIFDYIKHNELNDFFDHLIKSFPYEKSQLVKVEKIFENLKEKVCTKLILLIDFIFSEEEEKYFECLRIAKPSNSNLSFFNKLVNLKKNIFLSSNDETLEKEIVEFGRNILGIEELVYQINKYIMSSYGMNASKKK